MSTEGARPIQDYLNAPGLAYFNAINGESPESLAIRTNEIARLKTHLAKPEVVISIGVGQGEEIHSIHQLYNGSTRIIGVDMSTIALQAAKDRATNNLIPAYFLLGSTTDLPLSNESVDGVVLSSLMHEVYSFSPRGKDAWYRTIRDSARVLKENGCILLRDSAAPELRGNIQVQLRTVLSQEFYDYFAEEFRKFNGWKDSLKNAFTFPLPVFPSRNDADVVILSPWQAAELLFHFVNFSLGYPNDPNFIGNKNWKELNEIYYPPKEDESQEPMRTTEYVEEALKQGNIALQDAGFSLICAERDLSVRPRMRRPIEEHFLLADPHASQISSQSSSEMVGHFIKKMELVFQKVKN